MAERVPVEQRDALFLLEDRDQVVRRLLDDVDLARGDGIHLLLRVGHLDDLDAINLDDLAAGQARGRLGTRLVLEVLGVDVLLAGLGLGVDIDERARADLAVDLLEGVGVGHLLRHHERNLRRRLAERVEHQAVGLLQNHLEGLGVDFLEFLHEVHELLAHRVAGAPALDGSDAVLGRHRLAVVPLEAVAQGEGPDRLVGGYVVLVDHLRFDGVVLVRRKQRVVDEVAVIARDVSRRPDRIQDRQVAVLDELDDFTLGQYRPRTRQNRTGSQCRERTPHYFFHSAPSGFLPHRGRQGSPAFVDGRAGPRTPRADRATSW